MGKVTVDMTISLDGFICGPDDDLERLHSWLFVEKPPQDVAVLDDYFQNLGAVIMGRGTFEDGVKKQGWAGWVDQPPYEVPIFVVSHNVPEKLARGKTAFTFITTSIKAALAEAKAAAQGKNVSVMGGAKVVQQYIQAGLIEEINLHLAPLLLVEGKCLFENIGSQPVELEALQTIRSEKITHLKYRVVRP